MSLFRSLHLCQQSWAGRGGVVTLTLERDVYKFRVVQGESIYQTAGIAPFSHDLRKGGEEERNEGGSVRASVPWSTPPPLRDPTHTLVAQR